MLETKQFAVSGMHCVNCQTRLENALRVINGVEKVRVSYAKGTMRLTYNPELLTLQDITALVKQLDYSIARSDEKPRGASPVTITLTLASIIVLWMIVERLGVSSLAGAFPLARTGMGYGTLFFIGLITSVHCAVMCGGINLSQCIKKEIPDAPSAAHPLLNPPVLYNAGRVISYTVTGGLAGALGSALSVDGRFHGIIQIAAGAFMVLMGITMLDFFPALRRFSIRLPSLFSRKITAAKNVDENPFIIGLLNGLMPCGPLQAMQLYALSTGNFASGAFSMLLFGFGTVPLMFILSALSSVLSKRFNARVMRIGALLVAVLGLTMLSNGWALAGFSHQMAAQEGAPVRKNSAAEAETAGFVPDIVDGAQVVISTLLPDRYPAITVRQGIPVRWIINAPAGSVNGCNNRMFIREYGIEHQFTHGENVIEFMPENAGRFDYSCWMGMIRSRITVVPQE
jgi:sulfite exporter TauE/SafE/copper chaperone CopZ